MTRMLAPRPLFAAMAIAAAGLLGAAFFLEHQMGLVPCPLCMMQRIWVGVVGIVALIAAASGAGYRVAAAGVTLAALIGSGFSLRQLWLQSLPPDQVPACGPDLYYMMEVFPLSDVLRAMTVGTGDCAEVHPVLGLSIPAWVLMAFVAFIVAALLAWRGTAAVRAG
ncbi:MAG: disulfide bond formation protein B [Nitriliruptoraceae bacterium]|nr:disulfide bond formation protein B [Nitriliruptoraceae bacterium]